MTLADFPSPVAAPAAPLACDKCGRPLPAVLPGMTPRAERLAFERLIAHDVGSCVAGIHSDPYADAYEAGIARGFALELDEDGAA